MYVNLFRMMLEKVMRVRSRYASIFIPQRSIVLKPVRPSAPGRTREEKLQRLDEQASSGEPQPVATEQSYFEAYTPLQEPRLPLASSRNHAINYVADVPRVAKKEKDMRLKKNLRRPLSQSTAVSQSIALAMQTGTLPSLFNSSEGDGAYNDYYNVGDTKASIEDLGFKAAADTIIDPPSYKEPRYASRVQPTHPVLEAFGTDLDALPAQWFPGHMKAAMEVLGQRVRDVSLAVEVRDARVPLSSGNPMLDALLRHKTRIVVFNKADLVDDPQALMRRMAAELGVDYDAAQRADAVMHARLIHEFSSFEEVRADLAADARRDVRFGTFDPHSFRSRAKVLDKARARAAATTVEADAFLGRVLREHPSLRSLPATLVNCPHVISADRRVACVLTDGRSLRTVRALLSLVKAMAPPRKFKAVPASVLVAGYPNVGKSTLINALKTAAKATGAHSSGWTLNDNSTLHAGKTGAKAKVGATPGVTRRVEGFRVCEQPPIVVLDSPGIMVPRFERTPTGLATSYKLALVGSISDRAAGVVEQAGVLLRALNKAKKYAYTTLYRLPMGAPTNSIDALLYAICKSKGFRDLNARTWAEQLMGTRYGRALEGAELMTRLTRARERDRALGEGFGPLMDAWATRACQNTVGDGTGVAEDSAPAIARMRTLDGLSSTEWGVRLPSLEEVQYELTPELEERAAATLLQAFREGKLGKMDLDQVL